VSQTTPSVAIGRPTRTGTIARATRPAVRRTTTAARINTIVAHAVAATTCTECSPNRSTVNSNPAGDARFSRFARAPAMYCVQKPWSGPAIRFGQAPAALRSNRVAADSRKHCVES
jgi:hypothetical protein